MKNPRQEVLTLLGIFVLGALLRFYALDHILPGLYRDEAYNGLDALSVFGGERPIFFEANNGREPLFIYLAAFSVGVLGRSALALRAVSAIIGTLTILASYLLARSLFGSRVALLSAAITAGTFWAINLSRIGLRAGALPLFLALAFWQLWVGIQNRRIANFLIAGILWGLSFYTYLSARFTIVLILLFALYLLLSRQWLIGRRQTVVFLSAAVLTALPLTLYFLSNWGLTLERSFQVSIFNPRINHQELFGTFAGNLLGVLAMFNLRGDFIPRHNLPLRPVFDPLMGIFFLLGLTISIRQLRRSPQHAFIVIWLGVMLLPTLLAEGAPHFLRGVGILPAAFIFPAIGLEKIIKAGLARGRQRVAIIGVLVTLAISTFWSAGDYFLRHAPSEAVYYNFESGASQLAAEVNDFLSNAPSQQVAYLAGRFWENFPSLRFLIQPDTRIVILDGQPVPQTSPQQTMLLLWPFEDNRKALSLLPKAALILVEEGGLERGDLETEARLLYVSYLATPDVSVAEDLALRFGESISLVDAQAQFDGENLVLRLFWQANQKQDKEYIVFLHVLHNGQVIAQGDGPPAKGYYPTSLWREGDLILDERIIPLPESAGNNLQVRLGLYLLDSGERLPVFSPAGQMIGDSIVLEVLGD